MSSHILQFLFVANSFGFVEKVEFEFAFVCKKTSLCYSVQISACSVIIVIWLKQDYGNSNSIRGNTVSLKYELVKLQLYIRLKVKQVFGSCHQTLTHVNL